MVRPYKPLDRSDGHETWYCYVPAKKREPTESVVQQTPNSVLTSDEIAMLTEEPLHKGGKRGLRLRQEEKSRYMKLALDGGRKDLLKFKENVDRTEPVAYSVPDWYVGTTDRKETEHGVQNGSKDPEYERVLPDWFVHDREEDSLSEDHQLEQKPRVLKRAIFGWDTLSTWKRNETESETSLKTTGKKTQMKRNEARKGRDRSAQGSEQTLLKLPKIVPTKRNDDQSGRFGEWYNKWYVQGAVQKC